MSILLNAEQEGSQNGFIEFESPSKIELQLQSPAELGKKNGKWDIFYKSTLQAGEKSKKFITAEFAPSATAFYFGSFLQVLRKMMTHPEQDAEILKNFLTNQIFSASAQASFMMFLLGAKASNAALYNVAQKYSWLKDEKKISQIMKGLAEKNGKLGDLDNIFKSKTISKAELESWKKLRLEAERLTPGRLSLASFSKIQMFNGFGAGFLISTIFSDIVNDPDIIYYTDWLISSPDKYESMVLKMGYTPQEAYQRAYERWVTRGKIIDYTPHLLSAFSTIAIQAFVLPKAGRLVADKGLNFVQNSQGKIRKIAVKSIQLASKGASVVPQGKLLSIAVHAYTFLEINELLMPFFENIYHSYTTGSKIAKIQQNLNKKIIRPKVPESCFNQLKSRPGFKDDIFNNTSYSSIKVFFENSLNISCNNLKSSYPEQIKEFHYQMNHWREFWFHKSFASVTSWSSYLENINSQYLSSRKFYSDFITEVNNPDSMININLPLYGISPNNNAIEAAKVIADVYLIIDKNIEILKRKKTLTSAEKSILKIYNKLHGFLKVFDNKYKLPYAIELKLIPLKYQKMTEKEQNAFLISLKENLASQGIVQFNNDIMKDKLLSSEQADNIAEFGKIKNLLLNADPITAGQFFTDIQNQSLSMEEKEGYNYTAYGKKIKNITDLNLLNLACGPRYTDEGLPLDTKILSQIPVLGVSYTPPRILNVGSFNACFLNDQNGVLPQNFVHNNRTYSTLIEFAFYNINPLFRGKGYEENFNKFWQSSVDKEINSFFKSEEEKIKKLLSEDVFPAIASKEISNNLPIGLFEIYKYELNFYFKLLAPFYKKFPQKLEFSNKYYELFMYIYTRPNNQSSWDVKLKELGLTDFQSTFDTLMSAPGSQFTKMSLLLRLLKDRMIYSIVLKEDAELAEYSIDEIDVILSLIENMTQTADSVIGSISFTKFFEIMNPTHKAENL